MSYNQLLKDKQTATDNYQKAVANNDKAGSQKWGGKMTEILKKMQRYPESKKALDILNKR